MNGISSTIEKVLRYIHMHYSEHITLHQIASLLYMNPTYIGRLFRNEVGMTFNDYVVSYRIMNAKKMLELRDLSISDIAHAVGYDSLNYFFKLFKESTGTTPSLYRTNIQQHSVSIDNYSIIKNRIQDFSFAEILSIDIPHNYPCSGIFINLPSGLHFIFCQFTHPYSHIMCINSIDDGKNWSDSYELFHVRNSLSNLLGITQLNDGSIRIFFTEITEDIMQLSSMTSFDEMHTWEKTGTPLYLCHRPFWDCGKMIQLEKHKLMFPVSFQRFSSVKKDEQLNSLQFFSSDDNGQSWTRCTQTISLSLRKSGAGLHAPVLYCDKHGILHCYAATSLGCQYEMVSFDSGKTWSQPHPTIFTSPMTGIGIVTRANGNRIVVLDPIPDYACRSTNIHTSRLICMLENNDGSWTKPYIFASVIGADHITYETPVLFLSPDFILVSYTCSFSQKRQLHLCLIPFSKLI